MPPRDGRPDVLVVVLDCVRADRFREQVERGSLPFLASIAPEFRRFDRAVAPASWTIPSHASLFTGLYPWDHGAHYKAGAILGEGPPTIAELLAARGYRTASFSANGYVQPGTGLTRGFGSAVWGGDREFFLRFLARTPSCPSLNGADAAVHARLDQRSSASAVRVGTMRALSRFTPVCDALNRVGGRITEVPSAYVGSWIDPSIDAALAEAAETPCFFFVNLLEAHEPYFADGGRPIGLRDWLAYARSTQVSELWKTGDRSPSARDIAWTERDYLAALRVLDDRLRSIAARLKARDRWDETLVVITSDHGQTFGEGGQMYHRLNLLESITRVPLWVKPPRSAGTPSVADNATWVSLIDVPRTIAEVAAPGSSFGDPGSRSLLARDVDPGRTVYSMTDGLPAREAQSLSEERRRRLDRVQIAGYRGEFKTLLDQSGLLYRMRLEPGGAHLIAPGEPADGPDLADVLPRLRSVLNLPEPKSVADRIAGWGY